MGRKVSQVGIQNRFLGQLCALLLSFLDRVTVQDAKRSLRNRREEEKRDANSIISDIKLPFKMLLTVVLLTAEIVPILIFGQSVSPFWKLYNPYCHIACAAHYISYSVPCSSLLCLAAFAIVHQNDLATSFLLHHFRLFGGFLYVCTAMLAQWEKC